MVALSRPKSPMLPPRLPAAGRRRQLPTFFFSVFERSTPLLPITSLQPQQFHAITHSFAQRRAAIPPIFSGFRTLSIATGVCLGSNSRRQTFRRPTGQLFCLQKLGASLASLCTFFCIRFLCFQSLAASFPKTPGWGDRSFRNVSGGARGKDWIDGLANRPA